MIGGEHYLPHVESKDNLSSIIRGIWKNIEFFCTGRDAIYAALSNVSEKRLWIPDYLCESIHRPIRELGIAAEFYHVDQLTSDDESGEALGAEGDCVFIIHYFGMPKLRMLEALRRRNITTISDVTHVMLNIPALRDIGASSGLSVCSLRKTAALPDGGFVASSEIPLPAASRSPREQFWTLRAAALLSRGGSAATGFSSDENFHLFKQAERSIDDSSAGDHAMSDCSQYMLATVPWLEWSAKTAANHAYLQDRLAGIGVGARENAVSHLFPVLLQSRQQRDRVRNELKDRGIIAPIHWDTTFLEVPHWLSDRIISLPCDYRFSNAQIEYCAKSFLEAL